MSRSMLGIRGAKKATLGKPGLRPDIQGLRAFAVIVVILDHTIHWPKGGFIGVDVFFVISGFLITGHLLREHEKTGRISFLQFYKRRAKRILPAAALVLVVTVAAAYALLNPARFREAIWDAVWSLFFGANWRFAAIDTDYFQMDGPVSPLQHFWSLAVEEQFYFVWPWLLLGAFFLLLRKPGARPNAIAGCAIGIVSVASLAWAIFETSSNPGLAYFSTFSRAWELGVGAGLACAAPILGRMSDRARPVLAWAGVIGLVASLFVVSESAGFPAPSALFPVMSAALFIAAGTGAPSHRSLVVLTNPVSRYLGDISYSLYLWHFPVIVFGAALVPNKDVLYYAAVAVIILLLAVFAYHLVEDPIRKSAWLDGKKKAKHFRPSNQYKLTSLALLATVTLAVVGMAIAKTSSQPVTPLAGTAIGSVSPATSTPALSPELAEVQKGIQAASRAVEWPALSPAIEDLGSDAWGKQMEKVTCVNVQADNMQNCLFKNPGATKTAVLYGDSFAMAWSPGIKAALANSDYNLQILTLAQCPAATVSVTGDGGKAFPECDAHHAWATGVISAMKPDLLIMASAETTLGRLASKAKGGDAVSEYVNGMKTALQALAPSAKSVVVLSSPPGGQNLQTCVTKLSKPADCASTITSEWGNFVDKERAVSEAASAKYVDTHLWFCDEFGGCPAFVGTTPVRVDSNHMTIQYSTSLAPVLRAALLPKA
ncbi:acyltransferase family protein [Arthrobacter sp. 2RAF6]|uniref:acyltransferase family protein n=1 Tax=Arthrobacter sp. 2RAF6 TaxID=3233002 RepID=UPI003F9089A7